MRENASPMSLLRSGSVGSISYSGKSVNLSGVEFSSVVSVGGSAERHSRKIAGGAGKETDAPSRKESARHSVKGKSFEEDKYFARRVDRWTELGDGTRIKVGVVQKGSGLNQVGFPAAGMYFDTGKIKKAMGKHSDHLTKNVLKGIPVRFAG